MSTYSITGLVATTPRHLITQEGLAITSFRLASMVSDDQTNWFTVSCFHTLAKNASISINKGDRITVSGTMKIRDWDNGERSGTSVEIEADSIGHDLNYGTSKFERTSLAPQKTEEAKPKHECNCNKCDRRNN